MQRPLFLARLRWLAALAAVFCAALRASPTVSNPRCLLLAAVNVKNAIIAVGERGTIVRSIDSGKSWETLPSPTLATLTNITFGDTETGWIVGHDGIILSTLDGGLTWTPQFSAEKKETSFLGVAVLDLRRIFAVGSFGTFYATHDGGHSWESRNIIEQDSHLNRITAAPGSILYVAGEHGTLLRISEVGKTSVALHSPYDGSFYGILPLGPQQLLAYGLRSHLYRSDNDGQNWEALPASPAGLIATAIKLKSGTIVAAGQARLFFVSRDGAHTFGPWSPPLTTAVSELIQAADGALIAFGEAGASRLPSPDQLIGKP